MLQERALSPAFFLAAACGLPDAPERVGLLWSGMRTPPYTHRLHAWGRVLHGDNSLLDSVITLFLFVFGDWVGHRFLNPRRSKPSCLQGFPRDRAMWKITNGFNGNRLCSLFVSEEHIWPV